MGVTKKFLLQREMYATSFLYSSSNNTLSAYCGYHCNNKVSFVICTEVVLLCGLELYCTHKGTTYNNILVHRIHLYDSWLEFSILR